MVVKRSIDLPLLKKGGVLWEQNNLEKYLRSSNLLKMKKLYKNAPLFFLQKWAAFVQLPGEK